MFGSGSGNSRASPALVVNPCPLSPAREEIEVSAQRSAARWSNCTDNVWYLVYGISWSQETQVQVTL